MRDSSLPKNASNAVSHAGRATALEYFLRSHNTKPVHLARECGYSRQHLLRVRMGQMEPTRRCIASIVAALRRLTGTPVRPDALFDLTEP